MKFTFNTLHDILVKGKRVLVRADFNVPLDENGQITDDSRIRAALPTILHIIEQGGSVVLLSHLGRPKGRRIEDLSLAPVRKKLSELLGQEVQLAPDCVGETVEKMVGQLALGKALLLENVRFHEGEEKPLDHPDFIERLARIGDIYVNDAFATAHREHASTYYVADHFETVAAGCLIEKEVLLLSNLLTQAEPPFYALIGGSKVSSKIGVLESLLSKVDALFIGGGMAFTFLKAQGHEVGNSLVDEDHIETAKLLIKRCKQQGIDLFLPLDFVSAKSLTEDAEVRDVLVEEGIPQGWIGADIGAKTISSWEEHLGKANTIFWNGPMGVFELTPFAEGTRAIASILANSPAMTIVGGGDSAAAVINMGFAPRFTRISTGGGATLEYIEVGTLPALEMLSNNS